MKLTYIILLKNYIMNFVEFNNMWVEKGYTDFMKVNTSLEEFMEKRSKNIFNQIISIKKIF